MRSFWLVLAFGCGDNGTEPPPGDPAVFDAMARMPEVAAFAGQGARLVRLDARGVRADGTVDLTSPLLFGADYQFTREVPAPADAPPVGAGGSPDGRYHEDVTVRLWQPGQLRRVTVNGSSHDYRHRGMERTATIQPGAPSDIPPATTCSLATLWTGLAAAGAPAGAVAMVEYGDRGWRLWIPDTSFTATYDASCAPTGDTAKPMAEQP